MVKNNRTSFTLIEILVVSTITLIMSGISLAVFNIYKDDRALLNQTTHFIQAVQIAKSKALAGDTSQCTDSSTAYVSGYEVQVNANTIQIVPQCDTNPTPIVQDIDPLSIFVTPAFTLNFNNRGYNGQTVCIPVKNVSDSQCQFIKIDETGLVTSGRCTQCQPLVCPCP
ncbi:MAG: type II secretion system protein [Microgenomates group bacterium]